LNRIRIAAAALNQTPMAWNSNAKHIRSAIAAARGSEVSILCLPELAITGYGCEDMFFSAGVLQTAAEQLRQLLPDMKDMIVVLGLPLFHEGAIYNAAAVVCNGQLQGLVCKQHLAGDGIHYEPRWFRRWPAGMVGATEIGGREYPIGDLLFQLGDVRIGLEICRDAWVANRTGANLSQRGADILLNPSASHFAFAKQQIRERFVLEGSRAFCISYAYANLLGNEAGRSIYDGGTLIATGGKMIARGPRFSFTDWLITAAVVDVDCTRRMRAESFPHDVSRQKNSESGGLVTADFSYPPTTEQVGHTTFASNANPIPTTPSQSSWEAGTHQKAEEFACSVPLALFDYLRKSHSRGLVVSLSGGVDSAAVTVMVHLMVQLGCRELGARMFAEKLSQIRSLLAAAGNAESAKAFSRVQSQRLVRQLLTCVYQATRNSGPVTQNASEVVAEATGAEYIKWNIDAMVDQYVSAVSSAIDQPIDWSTDDVALQNIQARARGPGIWLLANLRNALLLTTSNRSEAAVGYATMDGDTCGGLAPIAGIDKAYLLEWMQWMERIGPDGIGPLPELSVVNDQKPTAELRPPAESQTDEGDLMPYRVLDSIERAAIRDKLLPVDVFEAVRPLFDQYSTAQIGVWVERFFQLWCRNQWKRERYAPSFHLDDENLDPKSWCRFPILNSGFEKELADLRRHVKNQ